MVNGGHDVPVDVPTLTPDQKQRLGVDTTQIKDSQGNVTGTRETITEVEALDSATVDSPNAIILKETTTTINYDVNNQIIDSSTQTTYTQQPTPQTQTEPQEIKVEFDTVEPAELETYQIPGYIEGVSWGDGSCPPPIGVSLSIGYFEIDTQPACDAATFINPFMLLLAGIISIYIISGVRGGTQT